jgi:hypothetical protein
MIPAEYILMKKLGKHYLIDSYKIIFKNMCTEFALKQYYFA